MQECYANSLCKICRKKDCDKRVEEYEADKRNKPCDGNCHACICAICNHSMIVKKPFTIMYNLRTCAMYYMQKSNGIKFYGRIGKNSVQSEVEQAIIQVYKCKECTFQSGIKSIQNLSDCQKYFIESEGITLEDFKCNHEKLKVCTSLKEVQKGIMYVVSENTGADVNKICDYLKKTVSNVFFVHELTIIPVLSELVNLNRIVKLEDQNYYIK